MAMIVTTQSGAKYRVQDNHIFRMAEHPAISARTGQPVHTPVRGDILEMHDPVVGQRFRFRLSSGWVTSTAVVEVRYDVDRPMLELVTSR